MSVTASTAKCKCQHCSQTLEFPDGHAGQVINCPTCGMETRLFVPGATVSVSAAEDGKERESKNNLIVLMVAGMLAFLGSISAVFDADLRDDLPIPAAVLIVVCGTVLYFIPSFIAAKKRQFTAILALNFLAGWTFLGWLGALVWACIKDKEKA